MGIFAVCRKPFSVGFFSLRGPRQGLNRVARKASLLLCDSP